MTAFALLLASAVALDSASEGTSKGLTVAQGLAKGLSAVKPLHRGITTVKLVPTERRHLVSFVDKGEVTKVLQPGHKGTATISLMPTHKKQDVQLLQTVPAAKAAFLSKDGPDPAMGEKGIGKGLPSQGYTGGSVMHEDGQTMTKDWMHEYDKDKPKPAPVSGALLFGVPALYFLFA